MYLEEAIEAGIEHSTDPAFPHKQGSDAIHRYFEGKLRTAEAAGNKDHASYILHNWLYYLPAWDGQRNTFLLRARTVLSLPPQSIQRTVFLARHIFDEYDDTQLSLDLIEHSYSAITDAKTAWENMNYLRLSKILILDILTSIDPWSDETKTAIFDVEMLCDTNRKFDERLLGSMKTILSRPSDDWLETKMQKSILKRVWGQFSAEARFDGADSSKELELTAALIAKIPEIPVPDDEEHE